MDISEVVNILQLPRDVIKTAVAQGIKHPKTDEIVKLKAQAIGNDYDIIDDWLDNFIEAFYSHEPKRKIPAAVRRELLVEARYKCANCSTTSPLQFHHIIEFSEVPTHDPEQMLVLCANCHGRCTSKEIDRTAQKMIKARLKNDQIDGNQFPARFDWGDLKEVIVTVHNVLNVTESGEESKYDKRNRPLSEKNHLNRMGKDYFEMILDQHQPYFGVIEDFLRNPTNRKVRQLYYEIVDELNSKVMAQRYQFGNFEEIFIQIRDTAKPFLKGKGRTLNIFLSFAYYKCDVGKK
jgi:DNA-directed RNA polymerase subunit RPC12/RpoP